jgi:lysophospholipase L1-like esterase
VQTRSRSRFPDVPESIAAALARHRGGFGLPTTAGLCLAEAPYHRRPSIAIRKGQTIYILGDSISAGAGTKERCWPSVLADVAPLSVANLAEPGATTRSAIKQAQHITKPNSVVLLEIGGNDVLGGGDAVAFRSSLDSLVSSLCSRGHQVIMFELPLFPFRNAFGKAQRNVAAKRGAVLLPKRLLARVLGLEGGTLDGLHLSQKGHDALARRIAELLVIEKKGD